MPAVETSYAKTRLGRIAYQMVGAGPVDLLTWNAVGVVDLMWDEPLFARCLDRLSSFSRHIWFDGRGRGASDPLPPGQPHILESSADDMVALLDALGCERVGVLGFAGGPELLFAATHPERTTALVLFCPSARIRCAEDYDGFSDEEYEQALRDIRDGWGTGMSLSPVAPSLAGDERVRRWWAKGERLNCTPDDAYRRYRGIFDGDVRDVIGTINVPTLVVTRRDWRFASQSRWVAEHINGARHLELPGEDKMFFAGDTGPVFDAIEEFVTGRLPVADVDRVLATVVFTDVVNSTEQAARLGDRRWRELLTAHDNIVRTELERCRGREIKNMGDGFLATFDGPGRAVRCACTIRDAVKTLGVEVRIGVHTGEIELRGNDIGGIAVHIAQRVQALASPGHVLTSRTVVDLVAGSELEFVDRGDHDLKGVPGSWRLFEVIA